MRNQLVQMSTTRSSFDQYCISHITISHGTAAARGPEVCRECSMTFPALPLLATNPGDATGFNQRRNGTKTHVNDLPWKSDIQRECKKLVRSRCGVRCVISAVRLLNLLVFSLLLRDRLRWPAGLHIYWRSRIRRMANEYKGIWRCLQSTRLRRQVLSASKLTDLNDRVSE